MPVQLAAGVRNRLVTIQQLTESVGPSGFPVESWSTLMTAMASKDDVTGQERFVDNQLTAPVETLWQVAYVPDLDSEQINIPKKRRLVYAGRIYDILSATVIGLHRGIELRTLAGGLLT